VSVEKLLEQHAVQDKDSFDAIAARLDSLETKLDGLQARLDKLNMTLTRYQGFFGGIVFVLSALWAVITWGLPWLKG
jgi:tetrahydromethanopterin S-methyltransferase subunit G